MPKINLQKYREYLGIKNDPALALMKAISDIKTDLKEMMTEMIGKELEKHIKEIPQIKGDKGEKPSKEEVLAMIKEVKHFFKGDKGDMPNKAEILSLINEAVKNDLRGKDAPMPIKGIDYFDGADGYTPKKGIDYFTKDDISKFLQVVFSNIIPPKKGVDYFTPKDIREFSQEIMDYLKISDILEKIEELKKIIENLKLNQKLGGQVLHRSGLALENPGTLGTGDGSTLIFTLPSTPYESNSLTQLFVGGGSMFETDDWTRSDKTITFITAPPSGAVVRNPLYRKA